MTNDPIDASLGADEESPLWAFTKQRALNRLALRTKLSIISVAAATEPTPKGYTAYAHENCYDGSGGHAIDDDGVANVTMRRVRSGAMRTQSAIASRTSRRRKPSTAGAGSAASACRQSSRRTPRLSRTRSL